MSLDHTPMNNPPPLHTLLSVDGEELVVKGEVRCEPNKKPILGSGLTEGDLCLGE